jgi:uncharacterized membrane protein
MDTDIPPSPSIGRLILDTVRRMFVSGVLVIVPIIATVIVLNFLFHTVDGILSPVLERFLGYSIPGMGLLATILLILLAGAFARNVIGSRLFSVGELLFVRTPLVRTVYSAAKQLVEAITLPQRKVFQRAVLVEYPRKGIYAIGFAAAKTLLNDGPLAGKLVAIFVPSTPTPVTGFVIMVPADEVYELDISTENVIKMLVSGGIATPPELFRLPRQDESIAEAHAT